jgi:glycosyltransferase involved in cell wall biosynthesis
MHHPLGYLRRIRVVHLLPDGRAGVPGGAVAHVQEMVDALCNLGVDAVASTLAEAPRQVDIVHLYVLGHLEHQAEAARAKWPTAAVALTPIFVPWSMRDVAATADRQVVVAATKNVVKNRLWWTRCRRVVRDAAAVFPCSDIEARGLSRFYRVRPNPMWRVATTGLRTAQWPDRAHDVPRRDRAAALGLPAHSQLLVVCAARLEPLKNQRALIRAVAAIDGAALVLFGAKNKQPYADDVVADGTQLLGSRFRWADRVERDEVRAALCAADVFALCSVREVASIAMLEAAASGCEVVSTRVGAAEEYFGNLVQLCSPSPKSIAAAIEASVRDPRQPQLRERVVTTFDWSRPATVVADAYRELTVSSARS